jgi:prepilin-type N-terminal cleavage/methylation domain-containing protein
MVFTASMKRPAFTLVEIMISAGIMSVLTAIVFFNFSQQNIKQALTQSIGTITTELQHALANAQSGITLDATNEPPVQFGVSFSALTSFDSFGDVQAITPNTRYYNGGTEKIQTFSFQKKVELYCLSTKGGVRYTNADIGYFLPSGKLSIMATAQGQSAPQSITDEFRITLRDTRSGNCQRVTLVAGVSTFSQKNLTSCSCP